MYPCMIRSADGSGRGRHSWYLHPEAFTPGISCIPPTRSGSWKRKRGNGFTASAAWKYVLPPRRACGFPRKAGYCPRTTFSPCTRIFRTLLMMPWKAGPTTRRNCSGKASCPRPCGFPCGNGGGGSPGGRFPAWKRTYTRFSPETRMRPSVGLSPCTVKRACRKGTRRRGSRPCWPPCTAGNCGTGIGFMPV